MISKGTPTFEKFMELSDICEKVFIIASVGKTLTIFSKFYFLPSVQIKVPLELT